MALPQVLAGPIVRRVAGTSVSVWVALRDSATVELTVRPGLQRSSGPGTVDSGVPHVAQGSTQTRQFGTHLHVAVVTANADGTVIAPGRCTATTDLTHPGGVLLRSAPEADVATDRLRLAEEEVPRDGAVVTRRYQLARTPSGGTVLWIGRRKRTGEGEGWSGLRFDTALPPGT